MEKPGQTGAGVRGVVISNERLTKSLGTGFRRCNSSENSYGFGHVLFPGAGVLGDSRAETLRSCNVTANS